VADLPNMDDLSSKKGLFKRLYVHRSAEQAYAHLSCIDSFVLLTKYMAEYMKVHQPYCVMEGIASAGDAGDGAHPLTDGLERIVYTGTLHRKFGVLHLLEAFRIMRDPSVRLVICGIGDSEAEIRQAASEDARIDFRGQLPREEVLRLQREATVLVNPRQNNETFTRYSFPSKTMEYLASGVPVVAYKLDGIPDEYDPYLTYPVGETASDLAEALAHVCALDTPVWEQVGQAGRTYVLTHKNQEVQAKRVLDFLSSNL
jgi:glycosyltransferase involved in cell wall biosynthesis